MTKAERVSEVQVDPRIQSRPPDSCRPPDRGTCTGPGQHWLVPAQKHKESRRGLPPPHGVRTRGADQGRWSSGIWSESRGSRGAITAGHRPADGPACAGLSPRRASALARAVLLHRAAVRALLSTSMQKLPPNAPGLPRPPWRALPRHLRSTRPPGDRKVTGSAAGRFSPRGPSWGLVPRAPW